MNVFYVKAIDHSGNPTQLAKYFDEASAAKHAQRMTHARGWKDIHVETANEPMDDQHHAHGGKVGK